jgi:hypothetical protein
MAAGDDDLQRLESSLAWLKRESAVARLEAGHRARDRVRHLPRAAQLSSVAGFPAPEAQASPRSRHMSVLEVVPPLPWERLQLPPPRRRHRHDLRGALCLLVACVIVGAIAYHVSSGGLLSAWEPAQAAPWVP